MLIGHSCLAHSESGVLEESRIMFDEIKKSIADYEKGLLTQGEVDQRIYLYQLREELKQAEVSVTEAEVEVARIRAEIARVTL